MRNLILISSMLFTIISFSQPTLREIANTLKKVESNNNINAVGDNGDAFGILQIHKGAVEDVNKTYGTNYEHSDAFDERCSEEIFFLYINIGVKRFIKKYNRRPLEHEIVRMWNGGIYQGYKIKATLIYYNSYLKKRRRGVLC